MKIYLLEDEDSAAARLCSFLESYAEKHNEFSYVLERYKDGTSFLNAYKDDAELIFLDIRLPNMTGLEVAQKIRKRDEMVMIVFITNLAQYAYAGYSVNAYDYILKPISYEAFETKMNRMLMLISAYSMQEKITIKNREKTICLPIQVILYIEVQNHDILIHTSNGLYKEWGTLNKYEEKLQKKHFVRTGAGFLINLKYVQEVYKDEIVVGGELVPLSRRKKKEFLEALAKYRGGTV